MAFFVIAAALAGMLIYLGIRISHRICGPVYHIRMVLKELREGKPLRAITLREKDELKELADDLNTTLEMLNPSARSANIPDQSP